MLITLHRSRSLAGLGVVLGLISAGYVPLASQNPNPIIVYSVAKYGPHLGHFWENVNFAISTPSLSVYTSYLLSLLTTIMDKSPGTLLRFWGVFQFTQVGLLPSPHKQCWTHACIQNFF